MNARSHFIALAFAGAAVLAGCSEKHAAPFTSKKAAPLPLADKFALCIPSSYMDPVAKVREEPMLFQDVRELIHQYEDGLTREKIDFSKKSVGTLIKTLQGDFPLDETYSCLFVSEKMARGGKPKALDPQPAEDPEKLSAPRPIQRYSL